MGFLLAGDRLFGDGTFRQLHFGQLDVFLMADARRLARRRHELAGSIRLEAFEHREAGLVAGEVAERNARRGAIDRQRIAPLRPQARIVAGYQPVMPTYQGLLSEEDVMRLVAYVKSLRAGEEGS